MSSPETYYMVVAVVTPHAGSRREGSTRRVRRFCEELPEAEREARAFEDDREVSLVTVVECRVIQAWSARSRMRVIHARSHVA